MASKKNSKKSVSSSEFKVTELLSCVIIPTLLLSAALGKVPEAFYLFLRVYIFGVMIFLMVRGDIKDLKGNFFYIIFAIIYNPVFPVHLTYEVWIPINIVTGLFLLSKVRDLIFRIKFFRRLFYLLTVVALITLNFIDEKGLLLGANEYIEATREVVYYETKSGNFKRVYSRYSDSSSNSLCQLEKTRSGDSYSQKLTSLDGHIDNDEGDLTTYCYYESYNSYLRFNFSVPQEWTVTREYGGITISDAARKAQDKYDAIPIPSQSLPEEEEMEAWLAHYRALLDAPTYYSFEAEKIDGFDKFAQKKSEERKLLLLHLILSNLALLLIAFVPIRLIIFVRKFIDSRGKKL